MWVWSLVYGHVPVISDFKGKVWGLTWVWLLAAAVQHTPSAVFSVVVRTMKVEVQSLAKCLGNCPIIE